jgi:hypothetical protein
MATAATDTTTARRTTSLRDSDAVVARSFMLLLLMGEGSGRLPRPSWMVAVVDPRRGERRPYRDGVVGSDHAVAVGWLVRPFASAG